MRFRILKTQKYFYANFWKRLSNMSFYKHRKKTVVWRSGKQNSSEFSVYNLLIFTFLHSFYKAAYARRGFFVLFSSEWKRRKSLFQFAPFVAKSKYAEGSDSRGDAGS